MYWTEKKLKLLTEKGPYMKARRLAMLLGCSVDSVYSKASRIGVKIGSRNLPRGQVRLRGRFQHFKDSKIEYTPPSYGVDEELIEKVKEACPEVTHPLEQELLARRLRDAEGSQYRASPSQSSMYSAESRDNNMRRTYPEPRAHTDLIIIRLMQFQYLIKFGNRIP